MKINKYSFCFYLFIFFVIFFTKTDVFAYQDCSNFFNYTVTSSGTRYINITTPTNWHSSTSVLAQLQREYPSDSLISSVIWEQGRPFNIASVPHSFQVNARQNSRYDLVFFLCSGGINFPLCSTYYCSVSAPPPPPDPCVPGTCSAATPSCGQTTTGSNGCTSCTKVGPACSIVDIKANSSNGPITISYNSAATLSWSSSNATSCTASNAWSGSKATNGSQSTGNLTSSKTYTITCNGSGENNIDTDSVTINVSTPPTPLTCNISTIDSVCTGSTQRNTISWTKNVSPTRFKVQVLTGASWEDVATNIAGSATSYPDSYQPTVNQTYRVVGISSTGSEIICGGTKEALAQKCSTDVTEVPCGIPPVERIIKGLFMSPSIIFQKQ